MNTKKGSESQKSMAFLEEAMGEKLSIALLLKSLRECNEWSQVEMAKKLGVTRHRICDIEHKRSYISVKMARTFAKKLKHSEELFVQIAIQDMLNREHMGFIVDIKKAA